MSNTIDVPKNWVVNIRYPVLAILVLASSGCFAYIFVGLRDDLTYQTMWLMGTLPGTALFSFLWWTFLAPFSWKTWRISMVFLTVLVAVFCGLFKFDSWTGSMWPQFVWRWNAYEEPGEDYFAKLQQKEQSAASKELADNIKRRESLVSSSNADDIGKFFLRTPEAIWSSKIYPKRPSLENIDGYSLAFGISSRNLFRENDPQHAETNWPKFRGPHQDGIVRNQRIETDWNAKEPKQLWHQKVGTGWSSFAVVDGMAFTQEQRQKMECVVCYDVETGRQIWVHEDQTRFRHPVGGDGPRATPAVVGSRVYTMGGTGILNCLDALTGQRNWGIELLDQGKADNLEWGMSCSPLVCGNLAIVNYGRFSGKSVVAFDRFTGVKAWETTGDQASYSSPVLKTIQGKQQVLVFSGVALVSYDPNSGKELWRIKKWENMPLVNAALPIVVGNKILISSGYQTGAALFEIAHREGTWSVTQIWRRENRFRLKFNDAVYKDGFVYGLDESFLSCLEFETGEIKWKLRENFGYGQVLLVGKNLLVSGENGEVSLLPATPKKPKVTARFRALDEKIGGITWNQPVLYRGLLLVRNNRQAACYNLRLTGLQASKSD